MDKPVVAQFGGYLAGVVQATWDAPSPPPGRCSRTCCAISPRRWSWCASPSCCPSSAAWLGTLAAATQNRWPDHDPPAVHVRRGLPHVLAGPAAEIRLRPAPGMAAAGRPARLALPPDTITGFTPSTACCTATSTPSCRRCPHAACRRWRCRFRRWRPSSASTAPRCWKCCARTSSRARRAAPWRVIAKYALRNAMLPTLAMIGLRFGWMLGGTVLIESVFDWPGIGLYAVQATMNSDFQPIMGVTLVLGVSFMLINFVIDIIYGLLDRASGSRVEHHVHHRPTHLPGCAARPGPPAAAVRQHLRAQQVRHAGPGHRRRLPAGGAVRAPGWRPIPRTPPAASSWRRSCCRPVRRTGSAPTRWATTCSRA